MSDGSFRPRVLDHVLSVQAQNTVQVPLLAYPREGTVADFELFTARDLHILVDRVAKHYSKLSLDPHQEAILSLVGPSDLDYFITKFALSRLGFGVLLISTRLAPEACLKLMRESQSRTIVQSSSALSFALGDKVHELDESINVVSLAESDIYRDASWDNEPLGLKCTFSREEAQHRTAIVYHSSGSTGLPKSIATSHVKLLAPIPTGKGTKALTSSPLCHAFASKLTINAMIAGKCMYLTSASVPSTSTTLAEALQAAKPDNFLTVPYILKLLAETDQGVQVLRTCQQVVSSGSTLSDELGNRLVQQGVNIETLFAGTEPGLVGTSMNRSPDDLAWDYIRLVPTIQQNTTYKQLGDNTFEFIYLKSLPTLNMSNSNDPPGSFHSSDIFTPHPTIPHAWKYAGRIDDRVTLSTGEKVLPLPMEGRIREEPVVREAVVFGIDRAIPGLLIFRADVAADMSDDEFLNAVWPAVDAANAVAEGFAQVGKDMVVCMPAGIHIPAADKESIIRAKVYKAYESEIDAAYAQLERGSDGGLVLKMDELERCLVDLARDEIGLPLRDGSTDFHQAGMDSLRAIRLRGLVMRKFAVGSPLSENVVFQAGNAHRLAKMILASPVPGEKQGLADEDEQSLMQELILKYSDVSRTPEVKEHRPPGTNVLLTGATGSLGAHLLSQMLELPSISSIYCIVRGTQPAEKVRQALKERDLCPDQSAKKVTYLEGDLSQPNLGLRDSALEDLGKHVTHIIHAAWPVNFQLGLPAFESQLRSLHDLLQLSLSTGRSRPARLLFCSSISVAMATAAPATIREAPIQDLAQASPTGYAQSKLVGEHIVANAVSEAGASAQILRIGQVVGDTKLGSWNDSEAWPLVVRSALTLKTLPAFDMYCSWLPVDTLASSMLEIMFPSVEPPITPLVLNLENPNKFHWTHGLLAVLKQSELDFEIVPPTTWLQQLREYHNTDSSEEASRENPAIKLLDYFQQLVESRPACEMSGKAAEAESNAKPEVAFDTTLAQACSPGLRSAPDVLSDGLVEKFLARWLQRWR